jgi:predicted DNA-binding protein
MFALQLLHDKQASSMSRQAIGARRHVILSAVQEKKLTQLAQKTGLTPSEHIRRAIDTYFRALDVAQRRGQT